MKRLITRKQIRLKYYNYANKGYYFITICTKNRECILSKIELNGKHQHISTLTSEGKIVIKYIHEIEKKYINVNVNEYIVMPNHIHMILQIQVNENITVSKIIQQFKGIITKHLGYSIWQKSFYEHIIRDNDEYIKIKQYIKNNVNNWENDIEYKKTQKTPKKLF